MKTDLVEIFQTIRAALQPYATLGFANRVNSDEVYDLWSDKNIKVNSEHRKETFFACVRIESTYVSFQYAARDTAPRLIKQITELDDILMKQVEDELSLTFKFFKEQEWI